MNKLVDKNVKFFSSGSTLLDLTLGGGWAVPRVSNIVGDKSTGKTLLGIEAFANFQRTFENARMRYAEAEAAFDEAYAEVLGFPKEVTRPEKALRTVSELEKDLYTFMQSPHPGLYILDSLDALSADEDRERFEARMEGKKEKGSMGAEKAKDLSSMFRNIVRDIETTNTKLIIISQLRDKIGITFGETKTRSGGHALDFYSTAVIWLYHMGIIDRVVRGEKHAIGIDVRSKVKKLKVGEPFKTADFSIIFGYGIDDEKSMLDWLKSVKGMDEVTVKSIKTDLERARVTASWSQIESIKQDLKQDTYRIWEEIQAALRPPIRKYEQGPLAQTVEQSTHNRESEGSSPSGPTTVDRQSLGDWRKRLQKQDDPKPVVG